MERIEQLHDKNHYKVELPNGKLEVFANPDIYQSFDSKPFEMADNNLRIPRPLFPFSVGAPI